MEVDGDGSSKRVGDQIEYVYCGKNMNYHTTSAYSSNTFNPLGVSFAWDFKKFKEDFRIEIRKINDEVIEFDMVGTEPSFANAFRRIMIAEVPTMAIEHVFFLNNTSIIQDEVFAHRLGLTPIKVNPRLFAYKKEDDSGSEKNTVIFKLDVTCQKKVVDGKTSTVHKKVFSSDLKWLPKGSEMPDETGCRFVKGQKEALVKKKIKPCHDDILLAKLRPGQCIQLEAHCTKGIGREHAKWSPVATAWYRLNPEVLLLKDVEGDQADVLVKEFPGLFEMDESDGKKTAKVTSARGNEILLEKLRRFSGDPPWEGVLQLRKRKNHFIYTVESVGQYRPEEIFTEAIDILMDKCDKLIASL